MRRMYCYIYYILIFLSIITNNNLSIDVFILIIQNTNFIVVPNQPATTTIINNMSIIININPQFSKYIYLAV